LTRIADGRGGRKRACSKIPGTARGIVTHTADNHRAEGKASGRSIADVVADSAADEAEDGLSKV
jgi:hypothetical protein